MNQRFEKSCCPPIRKCKQYLLKTLVHVHFNYTSEHQVRPEFIRIINRWHVLFYVLKKRVRHNTTPVNPSTKEEGSVIIYLRLLICPSIND